MFHFEPPKPEPAQPAPPPAPERKAEDKPAPEADEKPIITDYASI